MSTAAGPCTSPTSASSSPPRPSSTPCIAPVGHAAAPSLHRACVAADGAGSRACGSPAAAVLAPVLTQHCLLSTAGAGKRAILADFSGRAAQRWARWLPISYALFAGPLGTQSVLVSCDCHALWRTHASCSCRPDARHSLRAGCLANSTSG